MVNLNVKVFFLCVLITTTIFPQDSNINPFPESLLPKFIKVELTKTGVPVLRLSFDLVLYQEEHGQMWVNNAWRDTVKEIWSIDTAAKTLTALSMLKASTGYVNSMKILGSYRAMGLRDLILNSLEYYTWVNNDWKLTYRSTWTFDGNGFPVEMKTESDFGGTFLLTSRETYTNNAQGSPVLTIVQNISFSTMQLVNYKRLMNTYAVNGADLLTEQEARWVNSNWYDTARTVYTYNAHHDPLTIEDFILFGGGTSSQKSNLTTNTYDAAFNQLSELRQYYNTISSFYVNSGLTSWTYSATNHVLTELVERWNNNTWLPSTRYTSTYTANDMLQMELEEKYVNNAWVNATRYFYYYTPTGMHNETVASRSFSLCQNYPNPFNPVTRIKYGVGSNEAIGIRQQALVSLKVYDILGRQVATLMNEEQAPGVHEVQFNASSLPSGVYYYELSAGGFREVRKAVLMK